jgi:hypothetical protein
MQPSKQATIPPPLATTAPQSMLTELTRLFRLTALPRTSS